MGEMGQKYEQRGAERGVTEIRTPFSRRRVTSSLVRYIGATRIEFCLGALGWHPTSFPVM